MFLKSLNSLSFFPLVLNFFLFFSTIIVTAITPLFAVEQSHSHGTKSVFMFESFVREPGIKDCRQGRPEVTRRRQGSAVLVEYKGRLYFLSSSHVGYHGNQKDGICNLVKSPLVDPVLLDIHKTNVLLDRAVYTVAEESTTELENLKKLALQIDQLPSLESSAEVGQSVVATGFWGGLRQPHRFNGKLSEVRTEFPWLKSSRMLAAQLNSIAGFSGGLLSLVGKDGSETPAGIFSAQLLRYRSAGQTPAPASLPSHLLGPVNGAEPTFSSFGIWLSDFIPWIETQGEDLRFEIIPGSPRYSQFITFGGLKFSEEICFESDIQLMGSDMAGIGSDMAGIGSDMAGIGAGSGRVCALDVSVSNVEGYSWPIENQEVSESLRKEIAKSPNGYVTVDKVSDGSTTIGHLDILRFFNLIQNGFKSMIVSSPSLEPPKKVELSAVEIQRLKAKLDMRARELAKKRIQLEKLLKQGIKLLPQENAELFYFSLPVELKNTLNQLVAVGLPEYAREKLAPSVKKFRNDVVLKDFKQLSRVPYPAQLPVDLSLLKENHIAESYFGDARLCWWLRATVDEKIMILGAATELGDESEDLILAWAQTFPIATIPRTMSDMSSAESCQTAATEFKKEDIEELSFKSMHQMRSEGDVFGQPLKSISKQGLDSFKVEVVGGPECLGVRPEVSFYFTDAQSSQKFAIAPERMMMIDVEDRILDLGSIPEDVQRGLDSYLTIDIPLAAVDSSACKVQLFFGKKPPLVSAVSPVLMRDHHDGRSIRRELSKLHPQSLSTMSLIEESLLSYRRYLQDYFNLQYESL